MHHVDPELTTEAAALAAHLQAHGFALETIQDWISGRTPPAAEDLLIQWLDQTRRDDIREIIARALTQKDFKRAVPALLRQFRRSQNDSTRWAISHAVTFIGFERQHWTDILNLCADPRFARGRQNFVYVLHRVKLPETEGVLLSLVEDHDVDAFAIRALGYCGSFKSYEYLKTVDPTGRSFMFRYQHKSTLKRLAKKLAAGPN